MADLYLSWGAIGAYGSTLADGGTTSVDTGGVAVDITFDAQDDFASAFTFSGDGYVAADDGLNANSFLKIFDEVNNDGAAATASTVLDFRALDTALYTDNVQNVTFRINDIDLAASNGDLEDPAGDGFEDIVTVLAFDADGNPVPVTLTPETGDVTATGGTATGSSETTLTDAAGSLLVTISEPVSRIEIVYGNGDLGTQAVTVSDVSFSTVDVADNEPPVAVDDSAETPEDTAVTIDLLDNDSDPDGDPLTLTDADAPNGSVTDNGDGTVDYVPDPGFVGEDTITYTITDPDGETDTAVAIVTVTPANEPPVATDDTATTDEGTPIVINVIENDSDPDGDPLTVTFNTDPANGSVVDNGDGTFTYTPDDGFTGTDTFEYDVSDGSGDSDTGLVTVSVVDPGPGRIDTDVFPVDPADQSLDPLDGLDQDPDPSDDLDSVTTGGGDDVISTGDDADTISSGGGDDTVEPGIDDDLVDLGSGDDSVFDIQGSDTIFGGQGNDTINAGTNTFSDYEGDDPAFAPGTLLNDLGFTADPNQDDGRDSIQGNRGDDLIFTGDDSDTIDGGGDNDTIDAGIDDDLVFGGQGDDSIIGSHGSDTLDGGQGNDYIDGSNLAALELTDDIDAVPENDRDLITGALGDDTLIGGDDDDTLIGGSGSDLLDGGIDEDELLGGNDDDTLLGGAGGDTLNGGDGRDDIQGGADRDVIIVGSQAEGDGDTITGNAEGDDFDILDVTGLGVRGEDWRLVDTSPDSNGNGIDGTIEYLNGAGEVTGGFDFFEIEQVVPCFTPGTLIATPQGERLVEDLQVGDRVITRDNGIQEIKWVGRKDLTGHELARKPHMKPILIQKAALGNNLPEHDMLVSPNHRVLVANDKTALYFEEREVLVAAKHLTGLDGVDEVESLGVSYIHVMFDKHEVILSNGAWTESFQPGDYSLKGIGNAQRQEILELFPELEHAEGLNAYSSARRSLKKHEAALLTK